ncbi:hypothetical protein EJM73_09550 [Clostridium botulinum]|uniref:type II toxin-antitoxin system PemK/MazF family toxin n=1 Tax=Clostridium botulinum TaxID=1491 RepID=UPI001375F211|nr:type II toxin-antitoxin system PemK/MazF family toxin [Clostridium botulinum]NCI19870.1 hypothetical protein [Clostridium botulinum]NCI35908.1 hypothetical protein [Clostridium botulinum]NCI71765.1 hypothetical protein [Clostridium botulinum]NDI38681.1 hypothetical protein [Clostridium botulinum]
MCKVGDIILVKNYTKDGQTMKKHSFIVLSDESGEIKGLSYDMICNVMSSFKDEKQKIRKLKYPGNFPITHDDTNILNGNQQDGFVKTEQLYYFNKNKLDYMVIGEVKDDIFNLILDFIEDELNVEMVNIVDNL